MARYFRSPRYKSHFLSFRPLSVILHIFYFKPLLPCIWIYFALVEHGIFEFGSVEIRGEVWWCQFVGQSQRAARSLEQCVNYRIRFLLKSALFPIY